MDNVLVTGGGGFVGSVIVRLLRERGCNVISASRNKYPELEKMGVLSRVGDISDPLFVDQICKGVDTVFHTAAKAGIWGGWSEYEKTNVDGTKNVISGCRKGGVKRLVYTSTPSVVFDRSDIVNGDESLPYPATFLCNYPKSKVIAEQMVLQANDSSLCTCAIRPHLIWGPHDPHLIPRLIERGKSRSLKIIGSGENLVDITYVDNVAHAHVLAAENMGKSSKIGGQAYFIGQERPVNLWEWINELYRDLDIEVVERRVSFRLAYIIGAILEKAYALLSISKEPKMTRFLAEQLARSHCFSHAKAEKDFGYKPIVSLEEGHKRLMKWLVENR
jgi:nucleoside-diphosphate-sugar epimerase